MFVDSARRYTGIAVNGVHGRTRWMLPKLAVFAVVLSLSASAKASVNWDAGCTYTLRGGLHDPHAPPLDGSCRNAGGQPPLTDIIGSFTTAAEASAGYDLHVAQGDLGFMFHAQAGASRRDDPVAYADAGSFARLGFDDEIEVASSTMPIGADVVIRFSGVVSATATLPPPETQMSTSLDVEALFSLMGPAIFESRSLCRGNTQSACDVMFDGDSTSFSSIVNARVGDVLTLSGSLSGFLFLQTAPREGSLGAGGRGTLEVVDRTFLTPLTGGVSLVAAGGTNYAAPIPEPATWVLMIAGMGLVAGVRKRRDRAISTHSAPPTTSN